jgi:hypothetical protein
MRFRFTLRDGPVLALGWAGAVLTALSAAGGAEADIRIDPVSPTQGEEARVTVTDLEGTPLSGVEIVAVYRPGSQVESLDSLGQTGPGGTLSWAPREAGVVTLRTVEGQAPAYSHNLSVRFRGLPVPGLIILIAAGVILYGGVIRGFRRLRQPPPARPPDT